MANEKRLKKKYFVDTEELLKTAEDNGFDLEVEWTIDHTPTADVVEVVHARWEEIGVADYKCSRCGFRFTSADPISMFQYCRCGAKMDGGNEDV